MISTIVSLAPLLKEWGFIIAFPLKSFRNSLFYCILQT